MSSSNGNQTNNQLSDKEVAHFEKMLPWLVNGTLAESEKLALESALSRCEKLRQEKEILRLLQQQVKQQKMPDVPLEFAWQKMKNKITAEKKQKLKTNDGLASRNSQKKWRSLAIAASVLFIIQSSSLLVTWNQDDHYTPLTTGLNNNLTKNRINAAIFTLQFADEAKAIDIYKLFREHQLSIVSGPSSVGLYRISGATDSLNDADKLFNQLKSRDDIIAHVQQDD